MANMEVLSENTQKMLSNSASIREFLGELLDNSSFVETDVFLSGDNDFYDTIPFGEGVVTGYGTIKDKSVYIVAQNAQALGGSLGKAHAEKIVKCINRAIQNQVPLISIIDSVGVRIGEGLGVLDGYAKIIKAVNELRCTNTHISIVKGTATGLMSVYAASADFSFISDSASLSLNPPMAISASAGLDLPASSILGANTHSTKNSLATFSYSNTAEIITKISDIFAYTGDLIDNSDDPNRTSVALNTTVSGDNLLDALCDDGKYLELNASFCPEIKTVLSAVNAIPVGIILTNATKQNPKLDRVALIKIKNFVKLVSSYNITLINLVDSQGIKLSLSEEETGIVGSAAELFSELSASNNAKIAVITGSAIGFSFTALCSKSMGYDYVLAFPTATIAPMSADAALNFMYSNELNNAKNPLEEREKLKDLYNAEAGNPFISAKNGSVDNIIEPALLRPYIASSLAMLTDRG